jgi:hypothetical protein
MLGGTINDFTDGRHSGRKQTTPPMGARGHYQIVVSMTSLMDAKAEGKQNNLRQNNSMNHQVGLKLTLAISMQVILQSCQLEAEHPLKKNSGLVVSLTLP